MKWLPVLIRHFLTAKVMKKLQSAWNNRSQRTRLMSRISSGLRSSRSLDHFSWGRFQSLASGLGSELGRSRSRGVASMWRSSGQFSERHWQQSKRSCQRKTCSYGPTFSSDYGTIWTKRNHHGGQEDHQCQSWSRNRGMTASQCW